MPREKNAHSATAKATVMDSETVDPAGGHCLPFQSHHRPRTRRRPPTRNQVERRRSRASNIETRARIATFPRSDQIVMTTDRNQSGFCSPETRRIKRIVVDGGAARTQTWLSCRSDESGAEAR